MITAAELDIVLDKYFVAVTIVAVADTICDALEYPDFGMIITSVSVN